MVYPTQVWQVVVAFGQSQIKSGSLECGCAFEIVFFCIFGIGTDGHFEIRNLVVTYRGERAEPLG